MEGPLSITDEIAELDFIMQVGTFRTGKLYQLCGTDYMFVVDEENLNYYSRRDNEPPISWMKRVGTHGLSSKVESFESVFESVSDEVKVDLAFNFNIFRGN